MEEHSDRETPAMMRPSPQKSTSNSVRFVLGLSSYVINNIGFMFAAVYLYRLAGLVRIFSSLIRFAKPYPGYN